MGVLLDQYFSCIHILLKQSFFSEFQVIPAAYIVNQVKFSCLFEPTPDIFSSIFFPECTELSANGIFH